MKARFTAVVLAGDRKSGDAVAQAAGVSCKALAPVGGIPMLLRVLAALEKAAAVADRIVCGPPRRYLQEAPDLQALIAAGRTTWTEPHATPSASAYAVLNNLPETQPVLLTTADHALLSPEIVDYFCAQALESGCDVVAALASYEKTVAAAFPDVRRTVIKLRDGGYCGCNLFAFLTPRGRRAAAFWRRVEQQRKRPWRVGLGVLGWIGVLRFVTGRLSLDQALENISDRMGLRAGVVVLPFPEAAVDVDTAADWRFVKALAGEFAVTRETVADLEAERR